ncbi:MAG: hypothetical protein ACI4VP_03795 [Clostridia bacterium]
MTNKDRIEIANIIKENLETIGFEITIREINNNYYKNNLQKLNYDILLTGNVVSIKPNLQEYLNFNIEDFPTEEETYNQIYQKYNENPNFMGLYFNSIIILYSKNLKGNFEGNWYDIFYNVDTWYKEKNKNF